MGVPKGCHIRQGRHKDECGLGRVHGSEQEVSCRSRKVYEGTTS